MTPDQLREAMDQGAKALARANETANDWRATCKRCGATLKGTLAELRAHKC